MGRKSKYTLEFKLKIINEYEARLISLRSAYDKYSVPRSTIKEWLMIYKSQGFNGLKGSHKNKKQDKETKIAAVEDYLNGIGSLKDICIKYKISSWSLLRRWIKVYNNSHKEFKTTGGIQLMTKGRKVTYDEKVEIVQYCIAKGKDYYAAMEKYNVSYQQIYSWIRKYEKNGVDGLVDRRGKAKPESELTDMDRLRLENKMLAAKNYELEMENRLLKKLEELERRGRSVK